MARLVPSAASLRYVTSCLGSQPIQCSSHLPTTQHQRLYSQLAQSCRATSVRSPISRPQSGTQSRHASTFARTSWLKAYTLDENIPSQQVRVKTPETESLEPPQLLRVLLKSINRKTHVVSLLSKEEQEGSVVVEVVEKDALKERLKAKEDRALEQMKQARKSKPKQLELNWAISGNDLQLKLRQLRDFLEKGKKVEVMLASKKRQRKATPEEAESVVKAIRKMVSEMSGTREIKPMEGQIGGQAILTLQQQGAAKPTAKGDTQVTEDNNADLKGHAPFV